MPSDTHKSTQYLGLLVVILLVGAALRWLGIGRMSSMLAYDEAYNALDALSLLEEPRLVPFFTDNFGRESGWVYLLVPSLAILGPTPFAVRVVAVMTGTLAPAAVYALARELFGKKIGVLSSAALAVLYWHVHLSHKALRGILLPLLGSLALAQLIRACRRNEVRHWALAGGLFGILAYTYFSASLWIAYAFLIQGFWILTDAELRKGALVSVLVSSAIALPLAMFTLGNPAGTLRRLGEVGVFSLESVRQNVWLWVRAWLHEGGNIVSHNLPGRPILDVPLSILFFVGLAYLVLVLGKRRPWAVLATFTLALFSLAPSILSNGAPNLLRAIGMTVPLAMIVGVGAAAIDKGVKPLRRYAIVLPLALFAWAGWNTAQDFLLWLDNQELFIKMEMHIIDAANYVADNEPDNLPIYFTPFNSAHPLPRFVGEGDLASRQVSTFKSSSCTVVSSNPAVYFSLDIYQPKFQETLLPWADLEVLYQEQATDDPRFTVLKATPRYSLSEMVGGEYTFTFDEAVAIRAIDPLPEESRQGEMIPISFAMRAVQSLDRFYTIFVHLQGDPSPYEGGLLQSGEDEPLCLSHPPPTWMSDEVIVQTVILPVPVQTEPGIYTIAIGLYDSQNGQRLSVTNPATQQDHTELFEVRVFASD